MNHLTNLLHGHFQENREKILEQFLQFLRFASISCDPSRAEEIEGCKEWVATFLRSIEGMSVSQWQTDEHPVIFAKDCSAGPSKPTVLIYNHYDVQPVDPIEQWDTDPFSPIVEGDFVYARGAQDNKGQCLYVLQAVKALKEILGDIPVNIKLLIEGNEETGSGGLAALLEEKKQELQADYIFVIDLSMKEADTPSITLGLRGNVALELSCQSSQVDLHSGSHGGVVYNPIHAIVEILASLRNAEGSINVPGFYEEIEPICEKMLHSICFDFDPKRYQNEFGALATGGETRYSPLERNWLRPTVEINGIYGGFSGEGVKTVIPAKAIAKITCRLVPGQEPQTIAKKLCAYMEKKAPLGVEVKTHIYPGGGEAVVTSPQSQAVQAVAGAFTEVFKKPPLYILAGGSIPIVSALQKISNAEIVLFGVGLASDAIHAPNEHFSFTRFFQGYLVVGNALDIIGQKKSPVESK